MSTDPTSNVAAFMKLFQGASFDANYQAKVARKALDVTRDQASAVAQMINPNLGKTVNLSA
jgi:hypothetical protein